MYFKVQQRREHAHPPTILQNNTQTRSIFGNAAPSLYVKQPNRGRGLGEGLVRSTGRVPGHEWTETGAGRMHMERRQRWLWVFCLVVAGACGRSDKGANTASDASLPDSAVDEEEMTGDAGDGDMSDPGADTNPDPEDPDPSSDGTAGGSNASPDDSTMTPALGEDLGWIVPDELKLCGDRACACANGIDDDGDGTADGFDSECTGPNDDDEGSFATGISGDNRDPKWQDCFFDGNSGAGDDDCRYHTDCLTGAKSQDDPDCQVSDACIDFCSARTPNGCDCFGCCEFTLPNGSTANVLINEDCKEEDLSACTSCVKAVDQCNNPCGECELCPGRTLDDLPATCFEGSDPGGVGDAGTSGGDPELGDSGNVPMPSCESGESACLGPADCGNGGYCAMGCCVTFSLE